jgi:hypothetical protein
MKDCYWAKCLWNGVQTEKFEHGRNELSQILKSELSRNLKCLQICTKFALWVIQSVSSR